MKLLKITLLTLLFTVVYNDVNAQTMTNLVHQELDKVDANAKVLVIAGKTYQYQLDIKNSSYRFVEDAKTSLSLSQIKAGEKYYFELMAKGNDVKGENYRYVIFISNNKPSE